MGRLIEPNAALLLLPVARNSIWVVVFGIPFERALKYHRMISRLMIIIVITHMSSWWNLWFKAFSYADAWKIITIDFSISDPTKKPAFVQIWGSKDKIIQNGELACLCAVLILLSSLNWVPTIPHTCTCLYFSTYSSYLQYSF